MRDDVRRPVKSSGANALRIAISSREETEKPAQATPSPKAYRRARPGASVGDDLRC